ncbi:MAG TPA: hypothetical protein VMT85_23870 [Thermoanaerobaculia bacterium]|nr:hypothetical protein [Thermoanaerobaculia bacterium]
MISHALGAGAGALGAGPPAEATAARGDTCTPSNETLTFEELVARVEAEERRYVFVGERHGIGPVKRFAVELANALDARGHQVALYVEGFRTDCPPSDESCWTLARWFNPDAFGTLLEEARVPVHALDPPERDARAMRMAATIASGSEPIRIVLVGGSHVRFAGDPRAEVRVFGGALGFPDPGDVVEAFPRAHSLTIGLDTAPPAHATGSGLRVDGCEYDVVLSTPESPGYWTGSALAERSPAPSQVLPTPESAASDAGSLAGSNRP